MTKCDCGAELGYEITPFMTEYKRRCPGCGKLNYIDTAPMDFGRLWGGINVKSVLISIQPKWVEKIASGEKTVEVRKTRPKIDTPFKCYIYCTDKKNSDNSPAYFPHLYLENGEKVKWKDNHFENTAFDVFLHRKVIGEFVCDKIDIINIPSYDLDNKCKQACLSVAEILDYLETPNAGRYDNKPCYGWHISDLKIYDTPKELGEFWKQDKCPYSSANDCTYGRYCFRAGEYNHKNGRCGETITRPPQSWCYVEEL